MSAEPPTLLEADLRRPRPKPAAAAPARVTDIVGELGGLGDGRLSQSGAHVSLVLPGERVTADVAAGRGDLVEVLEPSLQRVEPPCPHFGACGGCALQHWDLAAYREWKVRQLDRVLHGAGFDVGATLAFTAGPGERRRIGLHARPGDREAARLGYKARRSWSLAPIAVCPIADPRLVSALPDLARLAAPLFEHPKSAPTLHTTITETGIDVDISGVERKSGGLSADARVRIAQIASAADFARVSLDGEVLYGARPAVVRFGSASVALPPGSFLQAVAGAEAAMAQIALDAVAGAGRVADLFCGAGAFTLRLAEIAPVLAADMTPGAIAALAAAAGATAGLKGVTAEVRDLERRPVLAAELKRIDAVVFDPPRAGAAVQAGEIGRSKASVAVAVSCNPSTFVRDAAILRDAGFELASVAGVDQFLWSPHMELVGVFQR